MVAALLVGMLCLLPSLVPNSSRAQFGQLIAFKSPGNTTYYLDADTGNDEARGTRPTSAWKTLSRVNSTQFAPGDTIYIKAGTVYQGQLFPKGSGIPGRPVTIDSYGGGDRPAIHAEGDYDAALLLENTSAWHVRNLELTNKGEKPEAFRFGISVLAEDLGAVGDFELVNLFVHDVNGEDEPGLGEGAAIIFRNRGMNNPTRFEGVLVEGCTIQDAARNGICIISGHTDRNRWLANVDVNIRENSIKDVAGDGIRLTGCQNAIIEYNKIESAGKAESGEAAGVSLEACDNSLVQFNEVSLTAGQKSAAMRCGANSRENALQFNFSHDNSGAMAVVAGSPAEAGANQGHVGNNQTAVRYNISQNDQTAFSISGPVREAMLYNNTVYCGPDKQSIMLQVSRAGAGQPSALLANNAFFTMGSAVLEMGQNPVKKGDQAAIRFQHNAYFGDCQRPADELNPVTEDPLFIDPGMGQSMELGLNGYQTQSNSPLRRAGIRLSSHGRFDFWANPVSAGLPVDIGAYQSPSDNTDRADNPRD